jgi:general secretion pathway protein D
MHRCGTVFLCACLALLSAGCPKGKSQADYGQGRKAESIGDLDAALNFYNQALKADPNNADLKIKVNQLRFEASEVHIKKGLEMRKAGNLQGALAEFQRAGTIDPSSPVAEQELRRTAALISDKDRAADTAAEVPPDPNALPIATMPPAIKPLSHAPINLKMSNDAKIVFDTVAKLAGLTVIYDPDFPARRITTELNNVTLEQALDIVSLESKAFWKPVTENIIFVIPDQPQKRRDYEEQVVKTFYLANTVLPQDLTEIVTGLRQLLDLKRIHQLNSQNAIIIRDTPDKLLLAEKMISDIDKAKPEVVVQVEVLQARTDRLRDLGILPTQNATVTINPNATTTSSTATTGTTTGTTTNAQTVSLNQLRHLNGSDYSVTLPSITANAVLTDTYTKIIQNPEIRSIDGQPAKLRVGDKVPVATGSFQAGVGVGATGVNPLVNTQFQYLEVGVNVDITPRVHPNHEVSMKVIIEVSSVTGTSTIGGIQQPIISQRKIEHDIRLKEGEVNVLGGLFEKTDTRTLNGWPGLAKIPFMRYFFSDDKIDHEENDVLIVLTPRIVRIPEWTKANLSPMYSGSETNVQVRREVDVRTPTSQPVPGFQQPTPGMQQAPVAPASSNQGAASGINGGATTQTPGVTTNTPEGAAATTPAGTDAGAAQAKIRFEPQALSLKAGQTTTVGIVVDNVNDLYSIPLLLQYNPAVISIEEIQHGGFLSGGSQEIAIVSRVDKDHGQAIVSATRQPNTPGVTGSGTLMGVVVKGIAPGSSNLSIVQVNAKDSQQKPIPLVSSEATVQVQP